MLEDIPPLSQPVNRQPRASHPAGRPSPGSHDSGRFVVPVPATPASGGAAEPASGRHHPGEEAPVVRITNAPGPGEVAPPKWWANRGASLPETDREAEPTVLAPGHEG
jgi:hypothetical protein